MKSYNLIPDAPVPSGTPPITGGSLPYVPQLAHFLPENSIGPEYLSPASTNGWGGFFGWAAAHELQSVPNHLVF